MNIQKSIHTGLQGFYKVGVVDYSGHVVWQNEEFQKNLILNQGMDFVPYSGSFGQMMAYCYAGTGSRDNKITSSSEVSQSGNLLWLYPTGDITSFTQSHYGYTSVLQAGDVVQFADGTITQVQAVTDQSASLTSSAEVVSQSFTIWKTSQNGLHGFSKYTATLLTGTGNTQCIFSYNRATLQKTYDFSAETTAKTYAEIGVGYGTSHFNAFNRILLPTPLLVPSGSQLRAVYKMLITVTPSASVYRTNAPIGNWPVAPATNTNGTESVQAMSLYYWDTNGSFNTTPRSLEPSSQTSLCSLYISTTTSPILNPLLTASNPVPTGRTDNEVSIYLYKQGYIPGDYYIDKSGTFAVSQMNRTDIASMGFGSAEFGSAGNANNMGYAFLFEQTQSKNNLQTLTLIFRFSWGRTLEN